MGSSLSPVISDIVMQDLETKALKLKGSISLSFYVRCVDDIALICDTSDTDTLMNIFNLYYPKLKFTIEMSENKLTFFFLMLA